MTTTPTDLQDLRNCGSMLASVAADLDRAARHGLAGDLSASEVLDLLSNLDFAAGVVRTAHHSAVSLARANGSSWQQVADALGITRQAAHERFSTP